MPDIFFYGLFMDRTLLIEKGMQPINERVAKVEHYSLRIGRRATLVPTPNSVVHGIVMTLSDAELEALYSEPSVSDYRPEAVLAVFPGGTSKSVFCYNLPEPPRPDEHNREYALRLRALAGNLGLPADYVESIK